MIGGIQSNKIKYITSHVHWIHSIDKTKYISEVNKRADQQARTINLLIQVNISEEHQKNGCNPTELEGILDFARSCTNIKVKGLMGMAKFSTNPESIRGEFALLKSTLDKYVHLNGGNIKLRELSMGMSNDFEIAVEEGATMIRVGSAIFGARNYG